MRCLVVATCYIQACFRAREAVTRLGDPQPVRADRLERPAIGGDPEQDVTQIVIKGVGNLVGALERMGWTAEVDARLSELRREQLKLEGELAEVEDLLRTQNLELSDVALRYLADHFAEVLMSGSPEEVRKVYRGVIARAGLYSDKLVVAFAPPLFQGSGVRRQVGAKKPALDLLPLAVMSKAGTPSSQKLAMDGAPMESRRLGITS